MLDKPWTFILAIPSFTSPLHFFSDLNEMKIYFTNVLTRLSSLTTAAQQIFHETGAAKLIQILSKLQYCQIAESAICFW